MFLNRSRQVPAEDTPAFAGIAERFRRAGDLDRAIALCRDGLKKFPQLLSARVTLGWSLLDKGQYDEARTELEQVLRRAPDNLAAIRGLAELHERAESTMPIDAHAAWHHGASEEENATIDTSLLIEQPPAAAPVAPAASQPSQPITAPGSAPAAPAAAAVVAHVPAVAAAPAAPVATAAPVTSPVSIAPSVPAAAVVPPAPVAAAPSTLSVIEFTNSAGAPMTPVPEMPAAFTPEPATALTLDAPLAREASSVEEASSLDSVEDFSVELPATEPAVPAFQSTSPVFATAADDIDFGAAMPEPVLDEDLPAPAVLTPSIELDLPPDLVAQLEAAEDPSQDVLTLPVAAEVNLDALASVFSDDADISDDALISAEAPPRLESKFESAVTLEETSAPAFFEQADPLQASAIVEEQATPPVADDWTPAVDETASWLPEPAVASALDAVPAVSTPLSLSATPQTTLPEEAAPARVDLAGFMVGAVPPQPAAPVTATPSLSEMFGQPAAASERIAPLAVAAVSPPVIVARSPLPELELFLRKVQARRMQIAVGSVA